MSYIISLLAILCSQASYAHVKWFSDYSFEQAPLELSSLSSVYFWGLFALSLISLPLLIWVDEIGDKSTFYSKFNNFFDRYSDQGPLIMRVTMGAVLLMSWQGDSVIAPEIAISSPLLGWGQFLLALFLLFKETTILAGIGMVILYLMGIKSQGLFHMLDYMVYPAVGFYLIFSHLKNEKIKNLDLPVLYSGLGFSLCWVAFEKMIHPLRDEHGGWNLHLMTENFKFLPSSPDRLDILGEGHAHLYVDGKKIGRIYSDWYHLTLPSGTHKVKVTINTNSHKDYVYEGEQIMSEVTLSEDRDVKIGHEH